MFTSCSKSEKGSKPRWFKRWFLNAKGEDLKTWFKWQWATKVVKTTQIRTTTIKISHKLKTSKTFRTSKFRTIALPKADKSTTKRGSALMTLRQTRNMKRSSGHISKAWSSIVSITSSGCHHGAGTIPTIIPRCSLMSMST